MRAKDRLEEEVRQKHPWIMRLVLQRVDKARVLVDGEVVGAIGKGMVLLLGVKKKILRTVSTISLRSA